MEDPVPYNNLSQSNMEDPEQPSTFCTFSIEETNRNVKRISLMNIVMLVSLFCIVTIVLILVAVIIHQQSSFSEIEKSSIKIQSDIKYEFYSLCVRLLTPDQCTK